MTAITEEQIRAWGTELSLSPTAVAQILSMNAEEPVRIVTGGRSVRGIFPSTIVQSTIQFESHKGELILIWLAHYRWLCRIILDQACYLRIEYQSPDGRNRSFNYPPDYFWIGKSPLDISSGELAANGDPFRAEFIECKRAEADLEWAINVKENPKAQPWRYTKLKPGIWCSPPAQKAAEKLGLGHRIFIAERVKPTLVNNIEFLADYFEEPKENYLKKVEAKICEIVAGDPGVQLRKIIDAIEESEIDTLYFMIARRALYVDIDNESLAPNYTARVFLHSTQCEAKKMLDRVIAAGSDEPQAISELVIAAGTSFTIGEEPKAIVSVANDVVTLANGDERQVLLVGELERKFLAGQLTQITVGKTTPAGRFQDAISLWNSIGSDEWEEMFRRLDIITPLLYDKGSVARTNSRTHFRWIAAYRKAEIEFGTGFGVLGLRPKPRKGNNTRKLDIRVERILKRVIDESYLSKTAPEIELVWGECGRLCEKHKPPLNPPTRKTIYARIKERDQAKIVDKREGPRAAYEFASPYWDDEWDGLSIEGEHAWAVVHIDHTQMDIATPPTPDGLSLGRPWLTIMVSPKYKRILAVVISYETPSYRSCMAVIRECVRRHHRLPRIIVVDGGKEFDSIYFKQLLARFEIIKKVRLAAKPRFGAVLERTNCSINSRLLHNLPGNTKLTKRVRILTKEFDPEKLAIWPLQDLREIVFEFAYEWIDVLPDKLTGVTPHDAFVADFRLGGPRSHKIIKDDRDFMIRTLPTTKSGKARIQRREGVTVHRIPYWCKQLRNPNFIGKSFPVRYVPDDFSVIYILINGKWFECRSRRFQSVFRGLSESEINVASTELLAAAITLTEKRRAVSAKALATFFFSRRLSPKARRTQARAAANNAPSSHARRKQRSVSQSAQKSKAGPITHKGGASKSAPIGTVTVFPKRKQKEYTVKFVRRAKN